MKQIIKVMIKFKLKKNLLCLLVNLDINKTNFKIPNFKII